LIQRASSAVNDTSTAEITLTETHTRVTVQEVEFDLPAKTLDGRLLCASQCAYSNTTPPYFEGAGYKSGSTTVELTKGVNSVFIGETIDGIVLAFRGTRTKSPLDWLQNAALFLQRVNGVPGRVHTGFYRAVQSIWDPIRSTVLEMVKTSNTTKIFMTGHSKGGAMASLAAILFNRDPDLPNVTEVVTFASAKVGDSAFSKAYNKEINQMSYEFYLDIVPFLPPSQSTMDAMGEDGTVMMEG
jgi:predicted lipase